MSTDLSREDARRIALRAQRLELDSIEVAENGDLSRSLHRAVR